MTFGAKEISSFQAKKIMKARGYTYLEELEDDLGSLVVNDSQRGGESASKALSRIKNSKPDWWTQSWPPEVQA